jgi:acetylornithine deacetylase
LSVGRVWGGLSVNTVPDECCLEIDRRLLPGETPAAARQAVVRLLEEQCPQVPVTHDPPFLTAPPLAGLNNARLARRLAALAQSCGAPGEQIGVPYGTDAPAFEQQGIPTVVFGPGSIEQAHTADEWVAVDQLLTATEIYAALARWGLQRTTNA